MNFRTLLERTFRLIRDHPPLIALGTLIAILSAELGRLLDILLSPRRAGLPAAPTLSSLLAELRPGLLDPIQRLFQTVGARFGLAGMVGLAIVLLLLAIAVGVLILMARGALIAYAGRAPAAGAPGLSSALRAGWRRVWRLIIIASIPPIPITAGAIILAIAATLMILQAGGLEIANQPDVQQRIAGPLAVISLCVLGPLGLLAFILSLFRPLADRACVLEDRTVIASYRRSWEVVRQHFGEVAILALIHLALQVVVWAVLLIPRLLLSMCIPLVIPIWLVLGLLKTVFITLWTLAWLGWVQPSAREAPAEFV